MDAESKQIFKQYTQLNESLGLGPNGPSAVTITVGHTTNHPPKKTPGGISFSPSSDEEMSHTACKHAEDGCSCKDCPDCSKNTEEDECSEVQRDEVVYIQAGSLEGDSECDCSDDGEIDMARAQLLKAAEYATALFNQLENIDNLEGWTASKITKASDYLSSVYHALSYDNLDDGEY